MSAGAATHAMVGRGSRMTVLCSDGMRTRRATVGAP